MNNILYTSSFKDHLQNYIDLKRAIGYKFDTDASHLKRFDDFIIEKYPETTALTKEIVLDWCRKKTYEAQATQCTRASAMRQFGNWIPLESKLISFQKDITLEKASTCRIFIPLLSWQSFL